MTSPENNHPTYLGLSIFNLLCCCFPLGIAAIIYSCQVKNANAVGDSNQAAKASRTANILNILGIFFGVIVNIAAVVFFVVRLKLLH
ncbi:synapse differentiation-inducing gene protein 1-like [Anolis sagrei]|uniref:synapse differentiation-inducing gene protein 1-like n=1 Tax=Anolis sagrei TaxID=38937 RepID=UPI003520E593